jgi:hypothetical protein
MPDQIGTALSPSVRRDGLRLLPPGKRPSRGEATVDSETIETNTAICFSDLWLFRINQTDGQHRIAYTDEPVSKNIQIMFDRSLRMSSCLTACRQGPA